MCLTGLNNNVLNLQEYCVKFGVNDCKCLTTHAFLGKDYDENQMKTKHFKDLDYDVIIVDEFLLIEPEILERLLIIMKKFKRNLIF